MSMEIRWEGLDELQRDLRAAESEVAPALGGAVTEATHGLRDAVVRAAPGHSLGAHVHERVQGSEDATTGEVYLTSPATIVQAGSRRHEIAPARRRALRIGRGFAAHVEHPGTRPNDFLERGVRDADHALDEALTHAVERVERQITR